MIGEYTIERSGEEYLCGFTLLWLPKGHGKVSRVTATESPKRWMMGIDHVSKNDGRWWLVNPGLLIEVTGGRCENLNR